MREALMSSHPAIPLPRLAPHLGARPLQEATVGYVTLGIENELWPDLPFPPLRSPQEVYGAPEPGGNTPQRLHGDPGPTLASDDSIKRRPPLGYARIESTER